MSCAEQEPAEERKWGLKFNLSLAYQVGSVYPKGQLFLTSTKALQEQAAALSRKTPFSILRKWMNGDVINSDWNTGGKKTVLG